MTRPVDYSKPLKNARHERVAQLLYEGVGKVDAHEQAGYARNSGNYKRIVDHPDVQGRIEFLQGEGAERAQLTVHDIVKRLEEDREVAKSNKQASAMVQADMGTAKVLGLVIDRSVGVQKSIDDMTEDELRALLGTIEASKRDAS